MSQCVLDAIFADATLIKSLAMPLLYTIITFKIVIISIFFSSILHSVAYMFGKDLCWR